LKYIDMAADWNTNVASSPRLVTASEYDVSMEAPVGFEPESAAQICETIQSAEWVEREGFQWSMRMKWDKVTPASLVNVRGRIIRVQKVLQTTIGVLNCEGVLAAPSLYTQTAPGQGSGGVVTQTPRGRPVPTESVLMDIPVISQSDAPFGFYWAAGPQYPGQWAGATLYKSLDGGFNYIPVASITTPSTIGHTRDYEDSPVTSGVLAPYFGGDVVDESTLCVMLTKALTSSPSVAGRLRRQLRRKQEHGNLRSIATPSSSRRLTTARRFTRLPAGFVAGRERRPTSTTSAIRSCSCRRRLTSTRRKAS
jgi:hypothetical protein